MRRAPLDPFGDEYNLYAFLPKPEGAAALVLASRLSDARYIQVGPKVRECGDLNALSRKGGNMRALTRKRLFWALSTDEEGSNGEAEGLYLAGQTTRRLLPEAG
jgi:hypothetical protein